MTPSNGNYQKVSVTGNSDVKMVYSFNKSFKKINKIIIK